MHPGFGRPGAGYLRPALGLACDAAQACRFTASAGDVSDSAADGSGRADGVRLSIACPCLGALATPHLVISVAGGSGRAGAERASFACACAAAAIGQPTATLTATSNAAAPHPAFICRHPWRAEVVSALLAAFGVLGRRCRRCPISRGLFVVPLL